MRGSPAALREDMQASAHARRELFRIDPKGRVLSTRFPGIAVPPVGENLLDMVPDFLRPQYEFNHRRVLGGDPIQGLMHLARKGERSLMWTSCFKSAAEDGGAILGNCVDVKRARLALVAGSQLDRACLHLERHFERSVGVDELVAAAGVSRATLHRRFVRELSVSALDYLTMLRLDHAIQMMRERDPDIATLALESGFCDQSYFGKRFKEFTRLSPAQFLKHCEWQVE